MVKLTHWLTHYVSLLHLLFLSVPSEDPAWGIISSRRRRPREDEDEPAFLIKASPVYEAQGWPSSSRYVAFILRACTHTDTDTDTHTHTVTFTYIHTYVHTPPNSEKCLRFQSACTNLPSFLSGILKFNRLLHLHLESCTRCPPGAGPGRRVSARRQGVNAPIVSF